MGLVKEMPSLKDRPMCDAKPCPFCGKDILNRPAGPFNVAAAGGKKIYEDAMHYSPGCFLHALKISQMEVFLGWTERWNIRASDDPSL